MPKDIFVKIDKKGENQIKRDREVPWPRPRGKVVHGKRDISGLSWERTSASDTANPILLNNKITTICKEREISSPVL